MGDLEKILERFKNLLEVQRYTQQELIETKFSELELKEIIYLLGELKAVRGYGMDRTE